MLKGPKRSFVALVVVLGVKSCGKNVSNKQKMCKVTKNAPIEQKMFL